METKKIKAGREDRIFNITVTVISLVVLVIVLYPLYFVIIASISSPEDISGKGEVSSFRNQFRSL